MLDNVKSHLYEYRFQEGRWDRRQVEAPPLGTLSVVTTDEQSDQYMFTYEGFLTPTSLYYASDGQASRADQEAAELLRSRTASRRSSSKPSPKTARGSPTSSSIPSR